MSLPGSSGLDSKFALSREQCDNNDLMEFLADLDAGLWSNEDALCDKFIRTTIGETADPNNAYRAICLCFKRLSQSQQLPRAAANYAKAMKAYWKKKKMQERFYIKYKQLYEKYILEKEKDETANRFIKENYRIHGSLATKTAQDIIDKGGYLSDDSSKSEDHHPQRSILYKAVVPKQHDNDGEQPKVTLMSINIDLLLTQQDRAVECSQDGVSALSDLRLLSLDYIYLFSRGPPSITAYLDTDIEIPLLSSLDLSDNLEMVDSVAKNWCDEVSDLSFSCDIDPYTELQMKTISILSRAAESKNKSNTVP
ncbi:hypothetical protein DFQ28_000137 [Apophysomyces sp. BC1034]|nr:hypothetical protein DFQ30_000306 [Apophysomyces sp. BC1015]KAG0168369.1 hypothetical protein DFQ29_010181 [Apophysomyces sp. BC1021]KAG0184104.1 hypothetical protein DFQ28_000137 [Apophysomyces sp. BC1034]